MGKTENYFNFIVISLFLEKNSVIFLSPPFLSSSVKKLNLQVWGNSSDFTDCLLVSWGYDTLVLWESLSLRKIFKDKAEMSQAVLE